jgi:hypothetical protein
VAEQTRPLHVPKDARTVKHKRAPGALLFASMKAWRAADPGPSPGCTMLRSPPIEEALIDCARTVSKRGKERRSNSRSEMAV